VFICKKKEQKIQSKVKKQKKLTEPYNELIRIISLFPNRTPYDVMTLLSYGPNFHSENFDTVNRILEIQIKEDYQKRLERKGLIYQDEEVLIFDFFYFLDIIFSIPNFCFDIFFILINKTFSL